MTILRALAMGAALLWCGRAMVPNGAGPFAAVLLIAGSGPQDRDESLMGHKPFWVLIAAAAPQHAPTEIWEGTLALPGGVGVRVVLRVTREGSEVRAVMDSPDQGAKDIDIDSVSFEEGVLRFESKAVGCKYAGALSASADEAVGTFAQAGANLPLTLRRTNEAREPRRPQAPKAPFPYRAEEVAYDNTSTKITEANPTPHVRLAGTLLVPNGAGPFAAVLLIAGSGPQDRDESLMGHKPFWVLADALARRGVAVLRVDKRGVGASTGDFSGATSADFAADVEAGLAEDAQGARSCAAGRLGAADHDLADRGDGLPDQLAPRRHALGRRLAGALRQGHAADPPLALQRLLRHQRGLFALGVITKESLSDNWFVWNDKQTWLLYGIPALWVPIWIDLGLRRQISIARGLLPQRWFHREPRVAAR